MSNIYLIDSENVGHSWKSIAEKCKEDDYIYVFLSPNSIHKKETDRLLSNCEAHKKIVNCPKKGHNAMDIVIGAYIGMLSKENDNKFIIVSNDNGYKSIISVLHPQIYIQQVCVKTVGASKKKISKEKRKKENANKKLEMFRSELMKNSIIREHSEELCRLVLNSNEKRETLQKGIVKKHGQEKGNIIYKEVRKILHIIWSK